MFRLPRYFHPENLFAGDTPVTTLTTHRTPKRPPRALNCSAVEQLEARTLLTASALGSAAVGNDASARVLALVSPAPKPAAPHISVKLTNGVLDIVGDRSTDSVVIQSSNHGRSIKVIAVATSGKRVSRVTRTVTTSAVHNILFENGGGPATLNSSVALPTTINNVAGKTAVTVPSVIVYTLTQPTKVDLTANLEWNAKNGPGTYAEAKHDLIAFQDPYGFIENRSVTEDAQHNQSISFTDTGDATWRTGLALIDAAMSGDSVQAATYLNALSTWGWKDGAPIRYPDDTTGSDGQPLPLSKDGFDTMLAGLYYAYTKLPQSSGVPAQATALVEQYASFLIANNWHLYAGNPPAGIKLDQLTLAPTEIYAFKFLAESMGIDEALSWVVPGDLAAEGLDVLRGEIATQLDSVLASIDIPINFQGADAGLASNVGGFHVDLTIPEAVRSAIVTSLSSLLGTSASLAQAPALLGQAISQNLSGLPSIVPTSAWQSLITEAVQTELSWFNPLDLDVAANFIAGFLQQQANLELNVSKGAPSSPTNYDYVNNFFWQVMPVVETHPEIIPLLLPSADVLNGLVAPDHMALFAWFVGDKTAVSGDQECCSQTTSGTTKTTSGNAPSATRRSISISPMPAPYPDSTFCSCRT